MFWGRMRCRCGTDKFPLGVFHGSKNWILAAGKNTWGTLVWNQKATTRILLMLKFQIYTWSNRSFRASYLAPSWARQRHRQWKPGVWEVTEIPESLHNPEAWLEKYLALRHRLTAPMFSLMQTMMENQVQVMSRAALSHAEHTAQDFTRPKY